MKALKIPLGSAARDLLREADRNNDGYIDFAEFETVIRKRQKMIAHLFNMLDATKDGHITAEEIRQQVGSALHIDLSPAEATAMINRICPTGGPVSYAHFRRAVALFPADTERDLIRLWQNSAALSFMLYNDAPKQQTSTSILLAGFIAGAVSRTCTAPFDRLSLVLRAGNTVHHGSSSLLGALKVAYT